MSVENKYKLSKIFWVITECENNNKIYHQVFPFYYESGKGYLLSLPNKIQLKIYDNIDVTAKHYAYFKPNVKKIINSGFVHYYSNSSTENKSGLNVCNIPFPKSFSIEHHFEFLQHCAYYVNEKQLKNLINHLNKTADKYYLKQNETTK